MRIRMGLKQIKLMNLLLIPTFLVSGCIVPEIDPKQEENCQLFTKELRLGMSVDENVISEGMSEALSSCHSPECLLAIPLAIIAIPVTSFIVSGSIVAVGDTLHWIEKQGRCSDSMTQKAIKTLVEEKAAEGGQGIESSVELFDWFEEHLEPKPEDKTPELKRYCWYCK